MTLRKRVIAALTYRETDPLPYNLSIEEDVAARLDAHPSTGPSAGSGQAQGRLWRAGPARARARPHWLGDMDVYEIKRRYGYDLRLWGGLGTQELLPFGTPDDVRAEIGRSRSPWRRIRSWARAAASS